MSQSPVVLWMLGLVVATFDLVLLNVEVLPDFFGFGLLSLGCLFLKKQNPKLDLLFNLSLVLVALEFLRTYLPNPALQVAIRGLYIAVIYIGFEEFARQSEEQDGDHVAFRLRQSRSFLVFMEAFFIIFLIFDVPAPSWEPWSQSPIP